MHNIYRSHTCGDLTARDIGKTVKLSGWIYRRRDHGGVFFMDLRDHYGIVQLVASNQENRTKRLTTDKFEKFISLTYESVITITGLVTARSEDTINNAISTGQIEVIVESYEVQSIAKQLPFCVDGDQSPSEDLRLKYRFLDLRREKQHKNINLRNSVIRYIREQMYSLGFYEFQTPILTASSPEGARDFVVPSRLHPGKFYALPQAPQQFKQLLMAAGFDKYFQIAPCFRDEDARADRAPGEFYQLDVEMSFVTQEDVFNIIEPVIAGIFTHFSSNKAILCPFPRIKYSEALLKYGTDKPDLRNPLIISDATELFKTSNFAIFRENIKRGAIVRAIPAPSTLPSARSFFDGIITYAQQILGAKGLAYLTFDVTGTAKGPIAKVLTKEELINIMQITGVKSGDSVFFTCEEENAAIKIAGKIREKLGECLNLLEKDTYKLCWIIDFPFFTVCEDGKGVDFSHNPFSMPQGGLEILEAADTLDKKLNITAFQYDIVCNGIELSSGAIRNHKPDIMYKAFEMVGYSKQNVDEAFGGMIRAFSYGVPPHGGIAPGIDRIVMLLANEPNIREVIAFPLNQSACDLMLEAPSTLTPARLRELHISTNVSLKTKH